MVGSINSFMLPKTNSRTLYLSALGGYFDLQN